MATDLETYFGEWKANLRGKHSFDRHRKAWPAWRETLRGVLQEKLGSFPDKRTPLEATCLERTECEGYVRERVELTTFEGMRMPMYVLIPEDAGERPVAAVLALHGHGYGSREICGLEPDGSPRDGDPGGHRDFAVSLVRRGFLVAAPELIGFGDRRFAKDASEGPRKSSCNRLALHLLMLGGTLAGYRVYEAMRALDYLTGRADVKADRIGAMGLSGGGLVAAFTSALDDRVARTVVSGYANTFRASILQRDHCLDNYIPGILAEAEMPDLIGLIAPRGLLIESGDRDAVFPAEAASEAYDRLRVIYEAAGAAELLEADFFSGGHEIGGAKAFDWLRELQD